MPIDYKRYPKNWKSEIVPAVIKRANNKCEFDGCDFVNKENVWSVKDAKGKTIWTRDLDEAIRISHEGIWQGWSKEMLMDSFVLRLVKVVLTVAHLDHDETNHNVNINRLKAMCQLHHLRYDAKEKYRRIMSN